MLKCLFLQADMFFFFQIVESRSILFIYLFIPPFIALHGSATIFFAAVMIYIDDNVHCRMYTCGGYPLSLVLVNDVRLV